MPTPSPIIAAMVGAAPETSMALASRAIQPRPTATATRVSAIGSSAATIVPKATTSTTRAASRPAASAPDVSVSALMNAASPPSSAATPAARAGAIASATAVSGAGPSSVAGRSKAISAKPTRPSGDTVPAANGSATVATCSTPAIRAGAASTAGRWPSSRSPAGAANTARALPPAASGKRSTSSAIASSLWLPGATRSSVNEPPAVPASPRTMAAATAHIPMVARGRRGRPPADGLALPRQTGRWRPPAGRRPPDGGDRIRPEMDDRAPGLAYGWSMPADQPRRFRGPFTRWPRAADAALAVAVFLATVFLVDRPGDAIVIRPAGDVPIPALLVFAVASAALYRRRQAPLAVLGVALVAWALTLGSGYADLGGGAIIALYSAGRD